MPAATVTLGLAVFDCLFLANLDDGTSLFAIIVITVYFCIPFVFVVYWPLLAVCDVYLNWKMIAFCVIRNCLKMPKFRWNFFDRPRLMETFAKRPEIFAITIPAGNNSVSMLGLSWVILMV